MATFVCAVCRRETEKDDIARDLEFGRLVRWCICLKCRDREDGTLLTVPPRLQREVTAIIAAADLSDGGPTGEGTRS